MITTIARQKPKAVVNETCGKYHRVMADGAQGFLTVKCELPKDHIPSTEHAALVRWSS